MAIRKANAKWQSGLRDGKGNVELESGAFSGLYSFSSRFEEGKGTNPEELLGAAHAACFSMALAVALENKGFKPRNVKTEASVSLDKVEGGSKITKIILETVVKVADIDNATFQKLAEETKVGCPVSQALSAVEVELKAELKNQD
jgi:lipoyl-dependent peroxiredoxin